jgi:pimeloyl-ACP methyl ester carboxylesterase
LVVGGITTYSHLAILLSNIIQRFSRHKIIMESSIRVRSCYTTILEREVHFTEFGDKATAKRHVLMVHGFVRTCRDFDAIAEYLAKNADAYVVCPDIIGRGLSEWSPNPEAEYNPVCYATMLAELLKQLNIEHVSYFGTSMGGIIAMIAIGFGLPLAANIDRLVLNDVGPHVNPLSLQRIMAYVLEPPVVKRASEMITATAEAYRGFGYNLTEEQVWRLLEPCIRRLDDGSLTMHFDPAIPKGLKPPPPGTPDMWSLYDKITCPTLVIRGEDSDVLLPETLEEMVQRGPKPKSVTIGESAHAPVFIDENDCEIVKNFITENDTQQE